MAKRGADVQITKDGRFEDTAMQEDTPLRATAAQIANRKIKAPRSRRLAGTSGNSVPGNTATAFNISAATTSPSFNFGATPPQQTNISTPFSFGSGSSFPPTNGAPATGNMTANKSFGGFSNGTESGFNFGGGSAAQATGTSSGNSGAPFSFGAPANNSFNFGSSGAVTQSANNPFAQSSNPAPQSTPFSFGSNNSINSNNSSQQSQPTQPQPSLFSNPFSSISTKPAEPESKPASSPFVFGSTPTPSFPAPQPAAISQPHQPSASLSPTLNPQSPSEEPVDDTSKANPFAAIPIPPRSPPKQSSPFDSSSNNTTAQTPKPLFSTTTTSTPASTNIFGASKPALAPPSAQETPSFSSNVFASAATSSFGVKPTVSSESLSKPATGFGSSPAKPLFATSNNSTPATSTPLTNMFGGASTTSPSTGVSASSDTPTPNVFSAFKPSVPPPSAVAATPSSSFLGNASPAKPSPPHAAKAQTIDSEALREQLSEGWIKADSLPKDPKERAYTTRDLKVYRLNQNVSSLIDNWSRSLQLTPSNRFVDLRPVWTNYGQYYEAIEAELQQRLGNRTSVPSPNGGPTSFGNSTVNSTGPPTLNQTAGFTGFGTAPSTQNVGAPAANSFGSTKRKADDDENEEERAKKSKPSPATPQSAQKSNTANKFESFLNSSTTQSKPAQNLFSSGPATPPQNKANAGSTPFKPATAFKPATTTSIDAPKAPASAPFKLFSTAPASTNDSAVPKPTLGTATTGGFKATGVASPFSGGFKPTGVAAPAVGGFKPTVVVGGGGFVSQFGKKSEQTAEELKRKAKMEEFDSDEDDEAEWERQYEEKQKQKQKAFEEAQAKLPAGPKFVPRASAPPKFSFLGDSDSNRSVNGDAANLSRSVSPAGSVLDGPKPLGGHMFSHLSPAPSESGKDDDDDDDDEDGQVNGTTTPKASGTGLFNRIGKDSLTNDNPGDHTWKENTPIKFGGATTSTPTPGIFKFPTPGAATNTTSTSAFGALFGSKTPTVTVSSPSAPNTPLPTTGFTFGSKSSALAPPSASNSVLPSADNSRAPTPQLGELSDSALDTSNETDDEESKSSDLVNFEGAIKGHEVLFKVEKAKALKYDKDVPKGNNNWVTQGVGPIAVLKNDESGAKSIFMKAAPSGRIVLNTRLVSAVEYKQVGKRARFLVQIGEGKMDSFLVQFSKDGDAKSFVEICEANKK